MSPRKGSQLGAAALRVINDCRRGDGTFPVGKVEHDADALFDVMTPNRQLAASLGLGDYLEGTKPVEEKGHGGVVNVGLANQSADIRRIPDVTQKCGHIGTSFRCRTESIIIIS